MARKDGKAYVFRIPYFDEVGLADQTYKMITARNLTEMKKALSMLQLMMQNLMIGTVDGDIYYVRNGRVPIRPAGFDYKRAMPGNTSKAEWQGIHKFEDLVQIQNPPQGYMQNCNVSPQFLMKDCPLVPSPEQPYLFNGFNGFDKLDQAYDNPLHQRAAMCVDLLHDSKKMTVEDAIDVALSPAVYGADQWQERLRKAWSSASEDVRQKKDLTTLYELIVELESPLRRRRPPAPWPTSIGKKRLARTSRRPTGPACRRRPRSPTPCCWPSWTRPPAS